MKEKRIGFGMSISMLEKYEIETESQSIQAAKDLLTGFKKAMYSLEKFTPQTYYTIR